MPLIRPEPFPPIGPTRIDPPPLLAADFALIASHGGWRAGWTQIVAGSFSDSPFNGLLCYDQAQGVAAFYETDGYGNLHLLGFDDSDTWRGTSWTHIVTGRFTDSPYSGLLLYDQSTGFSAFCSTNGQGGTERLGEDDTWRTSWSTIVAGRFSASLYDDILLYDRSAGLGAFLSTDGHGGNEQFAEYDDWRTTWTDIAPGMWGADDWAPPDPGHPDQPPQRTSLFFYEGETGYGETYVCVGSADIVQVGAQGGFPLGARVVAGNFGGPYYISWTNLLFLDQSLAHGQVWYGAGNPARELPADPRDHRSFAPGPHALTWFPIEWVDLDGTAYTSVTTGNFWVADTEDIKFDGGGFTDLAFYAAGNGDLDLYLKEPPPQPLDRLMGYASASSARPGETITFHVSSNAGSFGIDLYRLGATERSMGSLEVAPISPGPYPVPRNAWRDGAGWPVAATLRVPSTWPSGLYVARVITDSIVVGTGGVLEARTTLGVPGTRVAYDIPFVVRCPWPGTAASILVAVPDTTYEAYNNWGGRSFYTYGAGGAPIWVDPYSRFRAPRAFRVSFRRGFMSVDPRPGTDHKWKVWEVPFLAWLERHSIAADLCAISDLDREPDLLDGYRLFVSIGHDEYWSHEMRSRVERFADSGGNVAFLSGNTCYWQVRFERGGDTMACYKYAELDPVSASEPSLTTVQWTQQPVSNSERKLTGVSGANLFDPESVQFDDKHPSEVIRVYTVTDEDHWVFDGTNLSNGNVFGLYVRPDGQIRTALGSETDTRAEETPEAFRTLAEMVDPAGDVRAQMVIREGDSGRGTVFSAATIDWVLGLMSDDLYPEMSQITLNLMQRLGEA